MTFDMSSLSREKDRTLRLRDRWELTRPPLPVACGRSRQLLVYGFLSAVLTVICV
jgi:hypothetical protein